MTVTGEGLRIEMLETEKGFFFESGSAKPSETCVTLLTKLSEELAKLPNMLVVEGHTDSKPFGGAEYTNWELSADRANSARRVMQMHGIRPEQVAQVRGFADMQLFKKNDPTHDSNRRVTVIVRYGDGQLHPEAEVPATAAPSSHSSAAQHAGAH
jgi:chemotaxis protein MotB